MSRSGIKRGLDNQAIGLLPLLLFMFSNNYCTYLSSFWIFASSTFVLVTFFSLLIKDRVYQFMLLPCLVTLIGYSVLLLLKVDTTLIKYSPLLAELFMVVSLTVLGFFKSTIIQRLRNSKQPSFRRTQIRTQLNEFFFIAQIIQNLYTLHLFLLIIYGVFTEDDPRLSTHKFLARELNFILGIVVVVYEHIRLSLMTGSLKKEMWLPVLDAKEKVVGCIARSVSRTVRKKYFHPIVRVALMYDGMLYLERRPREDYVFAELLDYPFEKYVLFRHSLDDTVKYSLGERGKILDRTPRYLIKYVYENEKVKHLVSLYVLNVGTEEQLDLCKRKGGKLWTVKQIEENLGKGVFSGYFEAEFPYLQNTVLLAAQFCMSKDL